MVKPHVHNAFLRFQFNDLLLIPCALPPILLIQRWLRLRLHDAPPTPGEICFHVVVWSIVCEAIGPHFIHRATGDVRDVIAYMVGGVLAGLCWWRVEIHRRLAP